MLRFSKVVAAIGIVIMIASNVEGKRPAVGDMEDGTRYAILLCAGSIKPIATIGYRVVRYADHFWSRPQGRRILSDVALRNTGHYLIGIASAPRT